MADALALEVALCRVAFEARQRDARDRLEAAVARAREEHHRLGRIGSKTVETARRRQALEAHIHALAEVHEEYKNRNLSVLDEGATAELLAKARASKKGDPVARLFAQGKLDEDEARAAREIARLVRYATGSVGAQTLDFEAASAPNPEDAECYARATEYREWNAMLFANVYKAWGDRVREDAKLVLALAVEGESVKRLTVRFRLRWSTILQRLRRALSLYWAIRIRYLRTGEALGPQAEP